MKTNKVICIITTDLQYIFVGGEDVEKGNDLNVLDALHIEPSNIITIFGIA